MNELMALISTHPGWTVAVGAALPTLQWAFSAFVDSLPQPRPMGNQFYQFFFTFGHKLAGNLTRKTTPDANITASEKISQ